jgi:hypothetical protein
VVRPIRVFFIVVFRSADDCMRTNSNERDQSVKLENMQ